MSEGIVVRGGEGGTRAALEDLRGAAAVLATAAELLDDAGSSAGWARHEGLAGTASPSTARTAQVQVESLLHGPSSLRALAGTLRSLAWTVHRTAELYEDAERSAAGALRSALAVHGAVAGGHLVGTLAGSVLLAGWLLPRALLAGAVLRMAGAGLPGPSDLTVDVAEHAVQLLGGFGHGLVTRGLGPPAADPAVRTSGHLVGATALGGVVVPSLRRRPLRVAARLDAAGRVPPPRDAADVLAGVADLYPRGGGTAGTVGVDRLDHPDGSRGWVVTIPGTQEALSWGTSGNPMDMLTNASLMAATADDGTRLVARALHQAGARVGEPVLLAGHSQGGMVATALAGSAAFTARHPVAAVLTAGSPVATHAVPARTAALHLEHRQDLVPALDGWRNPDQPHRTTAVRDLTSSSAPADRWAARSPGGAHGVEAYARTATAVQAAGGRSVRGWEQAARRVLGGPGTTAYHQEFTGERVTPSESPGSRAGVRAARGAVRPGGGVPGAARAPGEPP